MCKTRLALAPRTPFRQGLAPNCSTKERSHHVSPRTWANFQSHDRMRMENWKIKAVETPRARTPFRVSHGAFSAQAGHSRFQQSLRGKEKRSNPVSPRTCAKNALPAPLEPRFARDLRQTALPKNARTPFQQGRVQKMNCPSPSDPVSPRTCAKNVLP